MDKEEINIMLDEKDEPEIIPEQIEQPPIEEKSRIEKVKELMDDATQDELVEFMLYFKKFLQKNLTGMAKGLKGGKRR